MSDQKPRQLAERYLAALNHGQLQGVLQLFTGDARVQSPLYGDMPAQEFFAALFADTGRSETSLIDVYHSSRNALALHFHYRWTLSNAEVVQFNVVDIFQVNAEVTQFTGLTIIYDTAPLRAEFAAVHRTRQAEK